MTAFRTSLCRVGQLEQATFEELPRSRWQMGDYVLGEVVHRGSPQALLELESGRMIEVSTGDLVIGALGVRHATLESTGSWEAIGEDGRMDLMTGAGLLGLLTSRSPFSPEPIHVVYRGHAQVGGEKATMHRWLPDAPPMRWEVPTILLIGSSMSAGKTATGRIIVRRLKRRGLHVLAAKLTGAGRWRDVLTMGDAGADSVWDFADAGLPSTVCDPGLYRERITGLLSRMAAQRPDVAVIEAGASPLEPYNGDTVVELLKDTIRFTVLCASDPYAVVGITSAFGTRVDLVAGITTNTLAGIELVEKLTGIPALCLLDAASLGSLDEHLTRALA